MVQLFWLLRIWVHLSLVTSIMLPTFHPNNIQVVYLKCMGGEDGTTSALAPRTGPLVLSPKTAGDDTAKTIDDWAGLRITENLIIQNRQAQIEVIPSASAQIIEAIKEPQRQKEAGNH